jgi:hypothetical protein
MIDFWIFPLSTIWGAYHLCGFSAFVLSNGSSLALFVGGIRVAKALMEKRRHNGKEKVIYASWKHRNTENYKFSWNKKYVIYWRIPGICGE